MGESEKDYRQLSDGLFTTSDAALLVFLARVRRVVRPYSLTVRVCVLLYPCITLPRVRLSQRVTLWI